MSKLARIKTTNRNLSGFNLLLPDEHIESAFDLRPKRFRFFHGENTRRKRAKENADEILRELVNLPEDPNSHAVAEFINTHHNLALGKIATAGRPAPAMSGQDIVDFRNLYRQFWMGLSDSYKAKLFLKLVGPWPAALVSPIEGMSGEQAEAYHAAGSATYPYADYIRSALRMNWRTAHNEIAARGTIDLLTGAVFRNRNKLRVCARPECKRLFIAQFPKQDLCRFPGSDCRRQSELERKRKWERKNRRGTV
jgi:hypothetical protein